MKRFLTLLLIVSSLTVFGQKNLQGKAVYLSKTSVDLSRWSNRQISEQQKKRIMDRMKNMLEKKFILKFSGTQSLYKEEAKLATPGAGGGRGFRMGGLTASGTAYKNTATETVLESKEFFGKQFLITEDAKRPEWEMSGETKQIGNYTCYKATWKKKTDEFDWTSFRPRRRNNNTKKDSAKTQNRNNSIERAKEVLVTAWYTPQIPVSNGPGEYWGLPGLILEIGYGTTTILCTEVVLNPKEKIKIEAPKKGEKVTRKEYNAIIKEKMDDMRERFRGRRRGRGRGF